MKKIQTLRMIIIPLIFFDFLFLNIRIGPIHMTLLRALLFLTVLIMIFTYLNKKVIKSKSKFVRYSIVFLYIWLIYSVFQLFYVLDFMSAINSIYYLLIYFMVILIFATVDDKEEWTKLMNIMSWVGIIIVFICLFEIITGNHLQVSRFAEDVVQLKRASTAVFYNENDLGLFLVMVFPLIYYKDSNKTRIIDILALICIPVIMLLNDSKSALLGIGMQIFFMILFSEKNKKIKKRLLITFTVMLVLLSGKIIELFLPFIDQIKNSYGSAGVRLGIYIKGLMALRESNYLGVGLGNFEVTLLEMFGDQGTTVNPHNWWMELLVSSGFLIFCLYLVFFIGMIIATYNLYKENTKRNKYVLAITITFIGFIIASLGPSSTYNKMFVWLCYGMGIGGVNIFKNKGRSVIDNGE